MKTKSWREWSRTKTKNSILRGEDFLKNGIEKLKNRRKRGLNGLKSISRCKERCLTSSRRSWIKMEVAVSTTWLSKHLRIIGHLEKTSMAISVSKVLQTEWGWAVQEWTSMRECWEDMQTTIKVNRSRWMKCWRLKRKKLKFSGM